MLHPAEWHNRWGFLRPAAARISTRTSNNHIVEGKLKFSWEGKSWESVGEKQLSERENYDNTVCYTEPTLGGGKKSKEKKKNTINFMDGETNFLPDLASCEGEKGKTLFRRWLFFFLQTHFAENFIAHCCSCDQNWWSLLCEREQKLLEKSATNCCWNCNSIRKIIYRLGFPLGPTSILKAQ